MASDEDLPLNANGPAYTSVQQRAGVPLDYVGEKLRRAIEALHTHGERHPDRRDELEAPMYYLLVAYLGLNNMLAKANDRSLPRRLLSSSRDQLDAWVAIVEHGGDVEGMAGLQNS